MREHWKTSQQQYKGKSTTNYSATTPPLLGWSLHRISPLYIILKKLPETFFSSYKRKNVFELKLKKIGSLLKHPPILQVMSSRAFQDISASLVSFFTWEIKNEAQRASPRAQYYDVSLICSSGLSDIWYDPHFLGVSTQFDPISNSTQALLSDTFKSSQPINGLVH